MVDRRTQVHQITVVKNTIKKIIMQQIDVCIQTKCDAIHACNATLGTHTHSKRAEKAICKGLKGEEYCCTSGILYTQIKRNI